MNRQLPLFHYGPEETVCRHGGRAVSARLFLNHVRQLAESLPPCRHIINLCNDRYRFMVGLAAALIKNRISLLPPDQLPATIEQLAQEYPESLCLVDKPLPDIRPPQLEPVLSDDLSAPQAYSIPLIESRQLVAILFTSGSTGVPKANPKYWGDLQQGIGMAVKRLAIRERGILGLVGTVPPQHMYGLETTILMPWFCAIPVHAGRPLFAADVRDCLAEIQAPRLLISTPIHLRACHAAGLDWPETELVISATAPLSAELAVSVESTLKTTVMEIFGSTETGSIASRRTIEGDWWRLYEPMSLTQNGNDFAIHGPQLPEPIILNDYLELQDEARFRLIGRHEDMVKIAGKRASISDLNHRLNGITGIEDGAFVLPESQDGEVTRLVALVVAPGLNRDQIQASLAKSLDPAFLPRRIYQVEALPRSATGKLPRLALIDLLKRLRQTA
jgi:acyl-coenzyme A synthetase/AMP-(fatty) acid ligase